MQTDAQREWDEDKCLLHTVSSPNNVQTQSWEKKNTFLACEKVTTIASRTKQTDKLTQMFSMEKQTEHSDKTKMPKQDGETQQIIL